jgi:cytidyltransferase-like protein
MGWQFAWLFYIYSPANVIPAKPPLMRIALFPGTFDPVTFGHIDIIERSAPLFDKLYVGIGINANKQPMFSADQRVGWLNELAE